MEDPMTKLLTRVLILDAATCLAMGGLLVAAAAPLAGLLELPRAVLFEVGIFLLPYAGFVLWASRNVDRVWPVRVVGFANLAWVVASFALLSIVTPNLLGMAFVAIQAIAVAGLAAIQLHLVGRSPAVA
jgi:hypothetical protein